MKEARFTVAAPPLPSIQWSRTLLEFAMHKVRHDAM